MLAEIIFENYTFSFEKTNKIYQNPNPAPLPVRKQANSDNRFNENIAQT